MVFSGDELLGILLFQRHLTLYNIVSYFYFQIVLETHERARQYDQVAMDLGSPINPDIVIYENYIYAMSNQKVTYLLMALFILKLIMVLHLLYIMSDLETL